MAVECAITNRMTITLLRERVVWDAAGRAERRKAHAALDTLDPGETSTVAEDMLHSYWNMAYHEGQINFIRTLSG